jgi:integration host factor subunit alpha
MILTKAHIAQAISQKTHHAKTQSSQLVDTLFEIIRETLESGEDVLISGFGKFTVRKKQERRGRNPKTGDALILAARKVVTFQHARALKKKLNPKGETRR